MQTFVSEVPQAESQALCDLRKACVSATRGLICPSSRICYRYSGIGRLALNAVVYKDELTLHKTFTMAVPTPQEGFLK